MNRPKSDKIAKENELISKTANLLYYSNMTRAHHTYISEVNNNTIH